MCDVYIAKWPDETYSLVVAEDSGDCLFWAIDQVGDPYYADCRLVCDIGDFELTTWKQDLGKTLQDRLAEMWDAYEEDEKVTISFSSYREAGLEG